MAYRLCLEDMVKIQGYLLRFPSLTFPGQRRKPVADASRSRYLAC